MRNSRLWFLLWACLLDKIFSQELLYIDENGPFASLGDTVHYPCIRDSRTGLVRLDPKVVYGKDYDHFCSNFFTENFTIHSYFVVKKIYIPRDMAIYQRVYPGDCSTHNPCVRNKKVDAILLGLTTAIIFFVLIFTK